MAVYITEHRGVAGRYRTPFTGPPLAAYSLSSASTGPFPSALAEFIRVSADAASLLAINSTSTASAVTSTNAFRIPANAPPELFSVSTGYRLMAQST